MPVQKVLAWSFHSELPLPAMKAKLDSKGPRPWQVGDSDRHGDYLGGTVSPEGVARIYQVEEGFVVNLKFLSMDGDATAQLERATGRVLQDVLPAVGARDVKPTSPVE